MLTVDLNAIVMNFDRLRERLNGVACAAVVKGDAYGLGMAPVARALAAAGCRRFFVATLDEAIALRVALADAAPDARIHTLSAPVAGIENDFDEARIVPGLFTPGQIESWSAHARRRGGRAAVIEIDSGMSRLGLTTAEVDALARSPDRMAGLDIEFVMSHLASSEDAEDPANARQLAAFNTLRARLPPAPASLANSGGIFLGPAYHLDMARAGAALYGICTAPQAIDEMAQVVQLKGKILQLRDVDSDSAVGYGAAGHIGAGGRLATVGVGYADGYLRSLGNRGSGFVGDIRVPIVGRVSMDLIIFDVSGVPRDAISEGGTIELIGPHHGAEALAAEAGTIGYEILAALGRRYHRVYTGGP